MSRPKWHNPHLGFTMPHSPFVLMFVACLQPKWELNKKAKHKPIFNEFRNKWLLWCPPEIFGTKRDKEKGDIRKKINGPEKSSNGGKLEMVVTWGK